jgi:predicted DNA-binding mobile mystery protein A
MLNLLRRQFDKQLAQVRPLAGLIQPSKGWIKVIREALGMTLSQLGQKMSMSPQAVEILEKSEAAHTISLKTLQKAAQALNCRVFYVLIPEKSLEETVEDQIQKKAREIVGNISHSMGLEEQSTSLEETKMQIKEVSEKIKRRKNISLIWEEEDH